MIEPEVVGEKAKANDVNPTNEKDSKEESSKEAEPGAGAMQKEENAAQGDLAALTKVLKGAPPEVLEVLQKNKSALGSKGGEFSKALALALNILPKAKISAGPAPVLTGNIINAGEAPTPVQEPSTDLKPETVNAILEEAERQWSLGFSDADELKYATGSSYKNKEEYSADDEDKNNPGHFSFEWCGAFAARAYQAAGISHQVAMGFASTVKLNEMIRYDAEDKFSVGNTFYESLEELRENPEKGVDGLKAYHESLGQKRRGIEVLEEGMLAGPEADNIVRLTIKPLDDLSTSLSGADINIGDIMIVGPKEKYGSHVTLVRDLDWNNGVIDTIEGNVSEPDSLGTGQYKEMKDESRQKFKDIQDDFNVMAYQVDSKYLTQQLPILDGMISELERMDEAKDKEWKSNIENWLNAQPGVDKYWYSRVKQDETKTPRDALEKIEKWHQRVSKQEFFDAVKDWEDTAIGNGITTDMTGRSEPRAAKLERELKVGDADDTSHPAIAGQTRSGKIRKRPMRYFYRIAQRDFEPYYYTSTAEATKAKAAETP
ncbi:MAG: hypothetical protein AUK47_15015 [Deltaproteobacteria bacterium CG2_30_63_29]|nr:MAG: hypothetical protein AUK47_15015 [Deltaproteobacteria bacterium CG2_30_63_29]